MHVKPPFTVWIRPERLEGNSRMTLILGMICRDRLLFCADREENTEGFGKRSFLRFMKVAGPTGRC